MSKKSFLIILIIIIGIGYLIYQSIDREEVKVDLQNASYLIEGEKTTLINGISETPIENSASKITTRYIGKEIEADFNNDNIKDYALILTQESGGSGTFYYLAVNLGTKNGYKELNAVFFGDRITFQEIETQNGIIIIKYKDRNITEPMVAIPLVEITKSFKIANNELLEI